MENPQIQIINFYNINNDLCYVFESEDSYFNEKANFTIGLFKYIEVNNEKPIKMELRFPTEQENKRNFEENCKLMMKENFRFARDAGFLIHW